MTYAQAINLSIDGNNLCIALRALMEYDNYEALRLNDGAYTWSVDMLYDAITDAIRESIYDDKDIENPEYSIQANGLYRIEEDGYLRSIPDYTFEYADAE